MPIMQITDKEVTLKEDKVILTLADTTYEDQTKLIGESEGITLETVESKNNLEAGLLLDIKSKQDALYSKFETYIDYIKAKSFSWRFGIIPIFSTYDYNFDSLGTNIQANKIADNALKNNIMQNEMYFAERRTKIATALWWLKTKWEERIKMALGDLLVSIPMGKVLNYTFHADQKKLMVALDLQCNVGSSSPQNDSGDYKFLRTPYFGAYTGTGDITFALETGAQYEYSYSSTEEGLIEPATPNNTSPVSAGTFTNANNYIWIKTRFPGGMVSECKYKKGTASSKSPDSLWAIIVNTNNNCRIQNAYTDLFYTLDGEKPNATKFSVLSSGFNFDIDTDSKAVIFCAVVESPLTSDLKYTPYTKFILPFGGYTNARAMVLVYDVSNEGTILNFAVNTASVMTSNTINNMQTTLDGKNLILESPVGLSVFDLKDWGISPVYRAYNELTLDDLIRVYK